MNKHTKELVEEIDTLVKNSSEDNNTSELEELRREKSLRENVSREIEEFSKLFPDTDVDEIPDEVWEACPDGSGICAQYALYLRRREVENKSAHTKNLENQASAVPYVKNTEETMYFTPEAVSKMTRAEVDKNYSAILESMKKWK